MGVPALTSRGKKAPARAFSFEKSNSLSIPHINAGIKHASSNLVKTRSLPLFYLSRSPRKILSRNLDSLSLSLARVAGSNDLHRERSSFRDFGRAEAVGGCTRVPLPPTESLKVAISRGQILRAAEEKSLLDSTRLDSHARARGQIPRETRGGYYR